MKEQQSADGAFSMQDYERPTTGDTYLGLPFDGQAHRPEFAVQPEGIIERLQKLIKSEQ